MYQWIESGGARPATSWPQLHPGPSVMDVAASLISLIQFSITSLKVIHQTFASLKDGPELVGYVAQSATGLLHILRQLEASPTVVQSKDDKLLEVIKTCHADVTRMAQKLASVGFGATEKTRVKLWRSAKAVLNEKEWTAFQTRLHEYTSLIQAFVILENSGKLHDMSSKMDDSSRSIQERLVSLAAKCDSIETKCDAAGGAARIPQMQGIIDSVRQVIKDQLGQFVLQSRSEAQLAGNVLHGDTPSPSTGIPAQFSGQLAAHDVSSRVDHLSSAMEQRRSNLPPESHPAHDIIEDIAQLVEEVKRLSAEAAASKAHSQIGHGGIVLYREVRFSYDDLAGVPMQGRSVEDVDSSALRVLPSGLVGIRSRSQTPELVLQEQHWTAEELRQKTQTLEAFFLLDRVRLSGTSVSTAMVNRKNLGRLVQWSQIDAGESKSLWIRGRHMLERDGQNPLTRIGIKLVRLASQAGVPVISYFCQLGRPGPIAEHRVSVEAAGLTAVLYAIIFQILSLLPMTLRQDVIDLSKQRFSRLDGTETSYETAFKILDDLTRYVAPPVFCIVDGLQWLENDTTQVHLQRLVRILRGSPLRVLFISAGTPRSLRDIFTRDETLVEENLKGDSSREDIERYSQEFWK
ncbi:hypothetical protein GQ53DRAFT_801186 [Thozetella sp. PMI_491]|nr:hypothetical protein GQ53DRAFT_801186 [Thozetella sp. PMI_491]